MWLFDFIIGWAIGRTVRNTALAAERSAWTERQKVAHQNALAEREAAQRALHEQQRPLLFILLAFLALIVIIALLTASAHAQEMCDLQHQCYHDDLAHPDRVTPPPAPQYRAPHPVAVEPANLCHLMTIREAPMLPARIVEICTMTPEAEAAIRARMGTHEVEAEPFNAPPWSLPR